MVTKPFDVFLSHSTKDNHLAAAMKQHLQSRGVRCWMAPDDIRAGENWAAAITRREFPLPHLTGVKSRVKLEGVLRRLFRFLASTTSGYATR